MKCNEIRELLSLYIDRELDESQVIDVEEHLSVCDDCRKEYDDLKKTADALNQTEMAPVPDAFQLRLKKALKDEKQTMLDAGIIKPEKKKNHWRIITSIAAVFAVGILSFGLYDNLTGFLPGGHGGNEQSGTAKMEGNLNMKASDSAVNPNESSDGSVVMKNHAPDSQQTAEASPLEDSDEIQTYGDGHQDKAVSGTGASPADDSELTQTPMYAMAVGSTGDAGNGEPTNAASEKALTDSSDTSADSTVSSSPEECSRSLTASGIERNAAAVQYYNNLIEEKLSDFDYQILESTYAQTGAWQFRIFIFRGKDGNTYNEEILIIGKDGKIETICPDETLGL
jgi:hypothetical protein